MTFFKTLSTHVGALVLSVAPASVFASAGSVSVPGDPPVRLTNPLQWDDLTSVLLAIVDVLIVLAVPIIIFFIIYAGFKYVTAQGNPQGIQDANRALLYALIGGVIILGARIIGSIIESTVNSVTI